TVIEAKPLGGFTAPLTKAIEAGSRVGVPACCAQRLASFCVRFLSQETTQTDRSAPSPSRQAPKSCISFCLSPRACSSLKSAANCSSSNFVRADAPSSPESSMRPPILTWLLEISAKTYWPCNKQNTLVLHIHLKQHSHLLPFPLS